VNKILLASMLALGITLVSSPAMARRGADDNVPGNVHQCRGCDDPPGHVRGGGRGADDPVGHEANEHANGHEMNEHENEVGHDRGRGRGRGADDGPNHQ
jgi:hypothetical protein